MTEAKYITLTHAAKEVLWLHRLIGEVFRPLCNPTTIYNDNQSTITLIKDGNYHIHTKHVDIRYHFIHLTYCPTDAMIANTLTKTLPSVKAKHFTSELGLCAN